MKSLIPLVILCNLLASGLSRASIEVSWFANAGVANVDSGGSLLTSDYTFELGAFTGSFVPTEANINNWAANWVGLGRTTYNQQVMAFSGAVLLSSNDAPFQAGSGAYIWGYNNSNPQEWILMSHSSWLWPNVGGFGSFPVGFNASQPGVVAVTGSVAQSGAFEISTEEEDEAFPPAQSFAEFQEENFPAGTSPSDIGEDGDPDGDGLSNLLEYAYGENPNLPSAILNQRLVVVNSGGTNFLQMQIDRSPRARVNWALQSSFILDNDFELLAPAAAVDLNEPSRLFLRGVTEIDAFPRRFLRVQVSLP